MLYFVIEDCNSKNINFHPKVSPVVTTPAKIAGLTFTFVFGIT